MSNIYLQHHGVKGQRWGVRRYQKKDGTLTKAGKRRKERLELVLNEEIRVARANKNVEESTIQSYKNGQTTKRQADIAKERLKAWTAAEKALMNTTIEDLRMSRKDIIEIGRKAAVRTVGFSPRI